MKRTVGFLAIFSGALLMWAAGCAMPSKGTAISNEDAEIAARVEQRLAFDAGLRNRIYDVHVSNGEVTVVGTVSSEAERLRLISIVRGTPGVTGVIDRLRIVR
jgi:osmotically-inducible protein OsmY